MGKRFFVKIGGEYACFTDPNLKVERVSYPVMTPAAARGVLEAIFWKPAFRWEVRSIKVLKPIRTLSVMRNEIESRQSDAPLVIEDKRQQRISLVLKDVEYVIEAEMNLLWKDKVLGGYYDQFERRLNRGAYHHAPYLGTREFSAWFEPATGAEQPTNQAIIEEMYLGVMFFDTAFVKSVDRRDMRFLRHTYTPDGQVRSPKEETGGYPHYLFYPAKVVNNQLMVPSEKYQELYRLEGKDV